MKRMHLIEIEDQRWCPQVIRNGVTDLLRFYLNTLKPYSSIAHRLNAALKKTDARHIVDLCSGGGGPWPSLLPELELPEGATVHMTDKFPNIENLNSVQKLLGKAVEVHPESNDATDLPENLQGFRTLFTSFHHFEPESAKKILCDAVNKNQGIAIVEFTHRSPLALALMLLGLITNILFSVLAKPFRWSRILFTFLIPVLPLVGTFDGIVSCLRTYTTKELQDMVNSLGADHYTWEIGEEKGSGPIPITYLIGYPKSDSEQRQP